VGLLARVSGERIRHELFMLLQEPQPESGLARMEELGVLRHIHPGLRCDGWVQRKFQTLRRVLSQWYEQSWRPSMVEEEHDALHGMPMPSDNIAQLYLSILSFRLIAPEVDTLIARIKLAKDDADLLAEVASLRDVLDLLQVKDVAPSEVVSLLEPFSGPAILVAWVATDSHRVRHHLSRYWQEYRHVKPVLTGEDLKELGLSPGPLYGRILGALRDARLNGQIESEQQERATVQEQMAEWREQPSERDSA
jgi:tRNA nucleotidyltransferase (CCA-adding enzyme)